MNNLFEKGLFFGAIKVLSSGGVETQIVAANQTTPVEGVQVYIPETVEWIRVCVDEHDGERAEIRVEGQFNRQTPESRVPYHISPYYRFGYNGPLGNGGIVDFGIPGTEPSVIHEAR